MEKRLCLRCRNEPLKRLNVPGDCEFYECLHCHRQYAHLPGKGLTFRWGHPISLALYGVIFECAPAQEEKISTSATHLIEGRSKDEIAELIEEIRLELNEPTQEIRDILDCRGTEQQLRTFLSKLCDRLENELSKT